MIYKTNHYPVVYKNIKPTSIVRVNMNKKETAYILYFQSLEHKISLAKSLNELIIRKKRLNNSGLSYKTESGLLALQKYNTNRS